MGCLSKFCKHQFRRKKVSCYKNFEKEVSLKKLVFLILLIPFLSGKISFSQYGCAKLSPGQSLEIKGMGRDCVVIESSKNLIYWVKITALPYKTGNPEVDRIYNQQPRALNYVGCKSYEKFLKDETCKFCGEDFSYTNFKIGDTLWFLVVGKADTDFCFITGGGPMRIETIIKSHQNDAGSERDASEKAPVSVSVDKIYEGSSAGDRDYYIVKIPAHSLIKFSVTYKKGPAGPRKLRYGLGGGGPEKNFFTYCTKDGKKTSSAFADGSSRWKKAYFPAVGETASCILDFRKAEKDIFLPFFIEPPLQYPPPDQPLKAKSDFVLPLYTFSFQIIETAGKN